MSLLPQTKAVTAALAFAIALLMPGICLAAGPAEATWPAPAGFSGWSLSRPTQSSPKPVLDWETGEGKSYFIPAVEVVGFTAVLNGLDRVFYPESDADGHNIYATTFKTYWDNVFRHHWELDTDSFSTNQFSHPYHGTVHYTMARSAGLDFWESFAYTFGGSLLWETAAETLPPSINDQIATGLGGPFLGEALFRMAGLVLEGGGSRPGPWRELAAAALTIPTGFNRLAFGERFRPVFPSRGPALSWRLRAEEGLCMRGESDVSPNAFTVCYQMSYGLPGKPGYGYSRPFDYFDFELNAQPNQRRTIESVMVRGLLLGEGYRAGSDYRGVWGLYGSYDYISPKPTRVSSTALSLGTTAQWNPARGVTLQGSLSGGAGYGAAGIIPGPGERNYHYGTTFQGLLALKLIISDRASAEFSGREYYVSGLAGTNHRGSELVGRWEAGLNFRVYGRHALGVSYLSSTRDAEYHGLPGASQSSEAYSVTYTFLGDTLFGAVGWE